MDIEFSKDEIENIKYCIEEVLRELNKNRFSSGFQFELETLNDKLFNYLNEM